MSDDTSMIQDDDPSAEPREVTGLRYCVRQEQCELLLAVVQRKLQLEAELRVQRSRWDAKRQLMNDLYITGLRMREAQRAFINDLQDTRLKPKQVAEERFDAVLARCKAAGREAAAGQR